MGANLRISTYILALAGTLASTGCSDMISLHPFVTDKDAVLDARLSGVWLEGDDLYIVRANGNGYTIGCTGKSSAAVYKLDARLLRVGEALILDLTPADEDAFQVAAHTPLRVWPEGWSLRVAFLDSQWLRDHAQGQLAMQEVGGRLLITSPGEEVTRFLLTYGADDRAYGKRAVLTRQE